MQLLSLIFNAGRTLNLHHIHALLEFSKNMEVLVALGPSRRYFSALNAALLTISVKRAAQLREMLLSRSLLAHQAVAADVKWLKKVTLGRISSNGAIQILFPFLSVERRDRKPSVDLAAFLLNSVAAIPYHVLNVIGVVHQDGP